jgi:hypothetical protein
MLLKALKILGYRGSLRAAMTRRLVRSLPFIPYPWRLEIDAVERPHYGYCVFHAATLAKQLGLTRISVIEFGVAGGNGLANLENHAIQAKKHLDVNVEVYGFDTGVGLPKPIDYRDQPYHWRGGHFAMDQAKLLARLRFAKVVLGRISEALPTFFAAFNPATIGAIFVDVDYYSSTMELFKLFDIGRDKILPRAYMYFDDIVGGDGELHSSFTGERLAISEFNGSHEDQKISEAFHLSSKDEDHGYWRNQIFIYHDFRHSDYCRFTLFNRAAPTSLALD